MFEKKWPKVLLTSVSYILVAALAVMATLAYSQLQYQTVPPGETKLERLKNLIEAQFIGEADPVVMEDAAAAAMVAATGDRWSYYIPASEMQSNEEHFQNAYVGIGVTISQREDGKGVDVLLVEPGSGAKEAGILPGDIMIAVEGQMISSVGINGARDLIRGKEGTKVSLSILRDGELMEVSVMRKTIQVQVASGQMLDNGIGLIKITNFNERCAQETVAQIALLQEQGAKALIFDVRFNPGGYRDELVKLLDYILPEGEVFRSQYYHGAETVDTSDASCLDIPMAVLINTDSYSAAEFFAAALQEYDYAITVGEHTVGKSYFQHTISLGDGSAVALSVGKYLTPNGVALAEVGGLAPDVEVIVDEDTAAKIYSELLTPEEDPQIQAAVKALLEE